MDRINLLLAALASGAASEKEGSSEEVKGAHADMRSLVKRHLGGRADAEMALERYEDKPDAERERLKDVLDSTGAVEDLSVVVAAQNLLKLVDPEGAAAGKYAMQPPSLPGIRIGH